MPCGDTRELATGQSVSCDMPAVGHTGRHTGVIGAYSFFGRDWGGVRIYWDLKPATGQQAGNQLPSLKVVAQKRAVLGQSDFVGPYRSTVIDTIAAPPPAAVDETTVITTVGAYSYNWPAGATKIDRILLGGGEGGENGGFITGQGGKAGLFAADTLTVANISGAITGTVGAPGAGNGGAGGNSTSSVSGGPTLTALGGNGQTGAFAGEDAGTFSYQGTDYPSDNAGDGGQGGLNFSAGPAGKRGQVWLRAYNT